jgi:hypothetical protein
MESNAVSLLLLHSCTDYKNTSKRSFSGAQFSTS